MVSFLNQDYIDYFILKTKQLGISNMWCRSKKSYVLNQSCAELSQFSAKERRGSNPFCFSIPLSYFNLLENDFKGEEYGILSFSSCTYVPLFPTDSAMTTCVWLCLQECAELCDNSLAGLRVSACCRVNVTTCDYERNLGFCDFQNHVISQESHMHVADCSSLLWQTKLENCLC